MFYVRGLNCWQTVVGEGGGLGGEKILIFFLDGKGECSTHLG